MARHKIIDTWKIKVRTDDVSVEVEVPLRLDKSNHDTSFVVDFHYGEHHLLLSGSDPNPLREQARKWLESVVSFKWDDFYYVEVLGFERERESGEDGELVAVETTAYFEFRHYQVATNAKGKKIYRDMSKRMNGGAVVEGEPAVGKGEGGWRDAAMYALVPKTPETEEALIAIANGFDELSNKLYDLLQPAKALRTLLNLSNSNIGLTLVKETPCSENSGENS